MKKGNSGRIIVRTADGSDTLYHAGLAEYYHSVHGALVESLHVFIEYGFRYVASRRSSIRLFEMGFGTGLNAMLSFAEAKLLKGRLTYHALEAFPVSEEEAKLLNYPALLNFENGNMTLAQLHELEWNEEHHLNEQLLFMKIAGLLQDFNSEEKYDLIYYDAFGPRVQPELWQQDMLDKSFQLLNENGVFVTYCAKGEVKRGLKKAGFVVESLPGPPGKREMTRAIKR